MALQLSYTTSDSTKQGAQATTRSWYQSFIPTTSFTLTGLEINIDSVVTGTAKSNIYFYNADADGKPTGAALGGGYLGSLSTTETGWQGDLTLSGTVELTSGSRYCFRLAGKIVSGEYHFDFDSADGYANGTCYYWNGSDYVAQNGDINFKIYGTGLAPGKPTNPSPTDDATNITLDESLLSWDASDPAADTYEVYFRVQGNDWDLVGEAQAGVEWAIDFGTLNYGVTYEWRIDATNVYGTTTGDTWTFSSIVFDPPLPTGVTLDGDGNPTGTPTGENNMYTVKRLVTAARNKIFYENV